MPHRNNVLIWLMVIVLGTAACVPNNAPLGPEAGDLASSSDQAIEIEVAREVVFTTLDGERQLLSAAEQVGSIEVGQGVGVDQKGRALLNFGEQMTVELLQGAELLQIQQFVVDGQSASVTVSQNGGTLIANLARSPQATNSLTIQTAFATVSATNARFAIVREANSPLEWVLGLEIAENGSLEVAANRTSRPVVSGQARWVTSGGDPGPAIVIDPAVENWLEAVRSGTDQPEIGAVILPPADILADASLLTSAPTPGRTVEFGRDVHGAITLTLDPQGIFGTPLYSLEDCNSDGSRDLAVRDGILLFDFGDLLARTQAVDITVLNRADAGQGLLQVLDPAGATVGQRLLSASSGETETLSLRGEQAYHAAELRLSNACFFGLSLTPPGPAGAPPEMRPVAEKVQRDVVVNVLADAAARTPQNGQLQASPVGPGGIQIDGQPEDWRTLTDQNDVAPLPFSSVVHDDGCALRYPNSTAAIDLAGQVQLAYDTQRLYLAFWVDDDGLAPYNGGDERYFLGDSPQLLLDLDLNGDFDTAQLSGDDVQVDFLPRSDSPRAALWRLSTLSSQILTDAQTGVTVTGSGYFLEAALPWQSLGYTPQPGDRLGLVASISDNDSPEQNAQECIIATSPQRDWRNPTTWGSVLLVPALAE